MEKSYLEDPSIKNIHFIGIGGISMSGLAEILVHLGYKLTGSDMKASDITDKLQTLGIKIYPFHSAENIKNPDLVVYTAAVKDNNPELMRARELGIPAIDRATLLGQLMKRYPQSITVSGTHGKTTTTSMITMIMLEAGLDPTVHIGGELGVIGGTTRIGGEKYFISEACEYVGSFLKFYPYIAVILNIEFDHADYFRDIEHVKDTFQSFMALVPREGYIVGCVDDDNVRELMEKVSCNKVTYGLHAKNAYWSARDIHFDDMGCAGFTLLRQGEPVTQITLGVPGLHNVKNALASIAACHLAGCSMQDMKRGLAGFSGARRRFELKGTVDGIKVIDDYAHHPSEISATLKAARNCGHNRIWCVFQPHTYTRTKSLMEDFAEAFHDADIVLLADIYAAREPDTGEVHSRMLEERMVSRGKNALYIQGFEAIVDYLQSHVVPGDLLITMGAGDIYKVGEMFITRLEAAVAAQA